jgi:hypothetical protein
MTDWQPSETAPRDGTWIEVSGEPYHEAKRGTCKAKWGKVETYVNGCACYLWCWIAQDGKFGFHCHEWRPINEPEAKYFEPRKRPEPPQPMKGTTHD